MNLENRQLLKGIALMLGAMSVVPMLDVIAKILSESYPVMQISWARFAFHTLWLLPLLYWQKLRWWRMPKQPSFHLLRSLMLTLATLFFFTAIKTNPIPNALTLLFVSPLIVAMLAPFVLGERFDIFIGIGVLVGFIGVIIVLQPDTDQFKPEPIVCACCRLLLFTLYYYNEKIDLKRPSSIDSFLYGYSWRSCPWADGFFGLGCS